MRVVVVLGGNTTLQRGEPMAAEAQHTNVRITAKALAGLARDHQIVVAHGNGPRVGLLALQGAAYDPAMPWPLDVLGAETEGMIGYLIEQELMNALPEGSQCATLLSRGWWHSRYAECEWRDDGRGGGHRQGSDIRRWLRASRRTHSCC